MTPAIWLVAIVAALALCAGIFVRLPPRRALAFVLFLGALGLGAARQFAFALPLGAMAFGMWQRGRGMSGPSPGQQSSVRTAALAMALDHDTGELDGEVLTGNYAGARLSDLAVADLQDMFAEIQASGDTESLALLGAYIERRTGGAGSAGPPPPEAEPRMSQAEAYRILGLEAGASRKQIREAYRRLIRKVHPDHGGSGALAAMINAARDLLDPD